jgi:membrane protease YdiL (CAAX protease family)
MLMDPEPPPEANPQTGSQLPRPPVLGSRPASTGPTAATAPSGAVLGGAAGSDRAVLEEEWWRLDTLLWVVLGLLASFGMGLAAAGVFKVKSDDLLAGMMITALFLDGAILILVTVLLRCHRVSWSAAFGFGAPDSASAVLLAAGITVLALPAAWTLAFLSGELMKLFHVAPVPQKAVTVVQESASLGPQVFMAGMAIVLAPLAEELFFRGVLYPSLKLPRVLGWSRPQWLARWLREGPCRWLWQARLRRPAAWSRSKLCPWLLRPRPWAAALITSVTFGAIHLNVMTFLPLTFFGLVLIWLYERTGNLLAPIVSHSLFNLANFFFLLWVRPTT